MSLFPYPIPLNNAEPEMFALRKTVSLAALRRTSFAKSISTAAAVRGSHGVQGMPIERKLKVNVTQLSPTGYPGQPNVASNED
ncbi:UNVERIFIED_CONTAM: hypothetical protein HDU68_010104 [Siphonaria sp. JEL0065]|nr:hypothetical protein HDU68_010104 [Siphonaria sp. JEL0065]